MTASPEQSTPSPDEQPTPEATGTEGTPTEAAAAPAQAEAAPAEAAPAEAAPAEEAQAPEAAPAEAAPAPEAAPAEAAPAAEAQAPEAAPAEAPAADAPAADAPAADAPAADSPAADSAAASPSADADAKPADGKETKAAKQGKDGKDGKEAKPKKKKPAGPDPAHIVKVIGSTSDAAIAYVSNPDPKLSRMARKHREAVISEIPPVTAGALLGPEALCRHFLASAAYGRYQDLFNLWDLFKSFPEDCKPVLASRQKAQEKARAKLRTATHLGLLGSAERVASDIDRAAGLPWRWMQEVLEPMAPAINQRPAVLAAMIRKGEFTPEIPAEPSDRWLAEAARLRDGDHPVPDQIDAVLAKYADRLPATLSSLAMAQESYPDRVPALIDRVDLGAPDIEAIMAWSRDHGHADLLASRIAGDVAEAATEDRAKGLSRWASWRDRGVEVPMPETLTAHTLDGLDLGRPESAELIKKLTDDGALLNPQSILDQVAAENRMLGEKAYESFVCAGFDNIHLPLALEGNPMVKPETRCPACQAWTWVRPGHEGRCPHDGMPLGSSPQAADAGQEIDAAVAAFTEPVAATAPTAPTGERPTAPPPAAAPAEATPAAEAAPADAAPTPDAAPEAGSGADAWTAEANAEASADAAASAAAPATAPETPASAAPAPTSPAPAPAPSEAPTQSEDAQA